MSGSAGSKKPRLSVADLMMRGSRTMTSAMPES